MKIGKKLENDTLTITLEGRLDTNSLPQLEQEIPDLDNIKKLIFDFEKLEYISSAGLRIILSLQKIMNNKGNMIIKNVCDDVREVLDITGFSDILTIE